MSSRRRGQRRVDEDEDEAGVVDVASRRATAVALRERPLRHALEGAASDAPAEQLEPADLQVKVHSAELEPATLSRAERDKLEVWIQVDLLGLGATKKEFVLSSKKCRPANAELPLTIDERLVVEPEWPLWEPLREALRSEEDEDSDVYFVLMARRERTKEGEGGSNKGFELGTAHLNLEQLKKRGHEPDRERLAVLDPQRRRVASITVTIRSIEALKWVARGADDSCRLGVSVGELRLSETGKERLGTTAGRAAMFVRVELPPGLKPLRTHEVRLTGNKAAFDYVGEADIAPGSSQQAALAAAVAAEDEDEADVEFILMAAGVAGGARERELASGVVGLRDVLKNEREPTRLKLPMRASGGIVASKQEPIGTLEVSLQALQFLKLLRNSGAAAELALPRPSPFQLLRKSKGLPIKEEDDDPFDEADEKPAPSGVPWDMFDGVQARPFSELVAAPGGRESGEKPRSRVQLAKETQAEREDRRTRGIAELSSMTLAVEQLARCRPKDSDWSADKWPKDRIKKLWRLMSMQTQVAQVEREIALRAQHGALLQLMGARAGRASEAARHRRRLDELKALATGEARDRKKLVEELLQREVLALYERLLHSLHSTARHVLGQLSLLAREVNRQQVLLEGWSAGEEQRLWRLLEAYAHALTRCTVVHGDPRGYASAGPGLSVASLEELRAASAGVLGPLAPLDLPPAERADAGRASRAGGKDSFRHEEVAAAEQEDEGEEDADDNQDRPPVPIQLRAERLRLTAEALSDMRGQTVQVVLSLLPVSLHLPAVRTPSVGMVGTELVLDYEGSLTLRRGGPAWRRLLSMLHEAPRALRHGPAPLQLQLQLLASRSAGAPRAVASGSVPLWPLLRGDEMAEQASRVTMHRIGGGAAYAEVVVGVQAPHLVEAVREQVASAPKASLTVRELKLDPTMLRKAGAHDVWIEADMMRIADVPLRTPGMNAGAEARAVFEHEFRLPVAANSAAEQRVVEQLRQGAAAVRLTVWCSSASGPRRLAQGEVPITASSHARVETGQRYHHTVELSRLEKPRADDPNVARADDHYGLPPPKVSTTPAGTLTISLQCRDVLRAATTRMHEEQVVQVAVTGLRLAAHLQNDVGVRGVWVEVVPPTCLLPHAITSKRMHSTRGQLRPDLESTLHVKSQQLQQLSLLLHQQAAKPAEETTATTATTVKSKTATSKDTDKLSAVEKRQAKEAAKEEKPKRRSFLRRSGSANNVDKRKERKKRRSDSYASSEEEEDEDADEDIDDYDAFVDAEQKKKKRAAAREASAADAKEARISFVVKAEHWRGELVLAATHVDLREMLRAGEDKVAAALSLRDVNGQQVAQLDVRLLALKTLRAAWWLGARREHFSVGMHGIRLNAAALDHAEASSDGAASVWIESSLCGIVPQPLRTSEVSFAWGHTPIEQTFEVHLPAGGSAATKFEHALRRSADAPLEWEVCSRAVGELGGGRLLGVASISLRQLLCDGGDLMRVEVPVIDSSGVVVGELEVSVLAQQVAYTLFGPRSWRREAIGVSLHEVRLEQAITKLPADALGSLWVELELLGKTAEKTGLRSMPVQRASDRGVLVLNTTLDISLDEDGPFYAPLKEALRSVEEEDSDIYFVLRGSRDGADERRGGGRKVEKGIELGSAHINLEQLKKRGHDPERERLAVLDPQQRRVASLTVSMRALEGLTWVARGADDSCRLGVSVSELRLSEGGKERLGTTAARGALFVQIELPPGMKPLRTREVRLTGNKASFAFAGGADVAPGSPQQAALAAALASEEEEEADVEFILMVAGVAGGEAEREVASGVVGLREILKDGKEPTRLVVSLRAGTKQAPLATLEVSLQGIKALRAAQRLIDDERKATSQRGMPGMLPLGAPPPSLPGVSHAEPGQPSEGPPLPLTAFLPPPPALSMTVSNQRHSVDRRALAEQFLGAKPTKPKQRVSAIGDFMDDDDGQDYDEPPPPPPPPGGPPPPPPPPPGGPPPPRC